jgi:hypothetical protein
MTRTAWDRYEYMHVATHPQSIVRVIVWRDKRLHANKWIDPVQLSNDDEIPVIDCLNVPLPWPYLGIAHCRWLPRWLKNLLLTRVVDGMDNEDVQHERARQLSAMVQRGEDFESFVNWQRVVTPLLAGRRVLGMTPDGRMTLLIEGGVWLTYDDEYAGCTVDGTRHVWERGRGYRTEDADTVPTDLAELIQEDLRYLW